LSSFVGCGVIRLLLIGVGELIVTQ